MIFTVWLGGKPLRHEHLKNLISWKLCGYTEMKVFTEDSKEIKELIERYSFLQNLIDKKKYALASDFLRYAIPYHYFQDSLTIYCDVDVTLLKAFKDEGFFPKDLEFCVGKENSRYYGSAILVSNGKHTFDKCVVDYYVSNIQEIEESFDAEDVTLTRTSPKIMTELIEQNIDKYKFSLIQDPTVFYPLYPWELGDSEFSDCTHAIHWNDGSWVDKSKTNSVDTTEEVSILLLEHIFNEM